MTQAHIESIAREARTELGPVEVCCLGGEARVLRLGAQAVELSDDHLMSDIGDAEAPSVLWEETKDVVDSVAAGTPATLKPLDTADKQKWYENATRILRDLGCIFE